MDIELVLLPRVAYRGREVPGPRLQRLLALLAEAIGSGRGTGVLIDELWTDARPAHPEKALQGVVFRARSQIGSDLIVSTPTGYRLGLEAAQVDVGALASLAARAAEYAAAGRHDAAIAAAESGLALWDGTTPGPTEAAGDPLAGLRNTAARDHRALQRERALALSRLGRHEEAVRPLGDLAAAAPRDEAVLLEAIRSQAAVESAAAALARYEAYRAGLADELGTDPGARLQAEYRRLLDEDAPVVRHGVAHEPNAFVGRDEDVAEVARRLRTSRVVSIVGTGGLGKTRLAHAVARGAEQRVVHVVELAAVARDAEVVTYVAASLGEPRHPPVGQQEVPEDPRAAILQALGTSPALLVLDNCEHVIGGAADLVQTLTRMTAELLVLTTSRTPLGLSSESAFLLPELAPPSAAELFLARARAARSDLEPELAAVERLCTRLDGLPLAIELAAARVRVMSIDEIDRRLADRFDVLRGGPRDAPPRHQTLQAVVEWSWELLGENARTALTLLAIFPSGFTADSARDVLAAPDDVLDLLEELVNQSLLKVTDTDGGTRFRMLETVRRFGNDHAGATGVDERAVAGFLHWARGFAGAHHDSLFGADPFRTARRISAEEENLLSALRLAADREDDATTAAAGAVLAGFWTIDSNFGRLATLSAETVGRMSHFRPAAAEIDTVRTLCVLCTTVTLMGSVGSAARWLVALRRLPYAPPDTVVRATWAVLQVFPGTSTAAGPAPLNRLRGSDEPYLAGVASGIATYVAESAGDTDGAIRAAEEMLAAFDGREVPLMAMVAHSRIGELSMQMGDADRASREFRKALNLVTRAGYERDVFQLRWAPVLADLQRGALDDAEAALRSAVNEEADATPDSTAFALSVRAEVSLARGEVDDGLALWRAAVSQTSERDLDVFAVEQVGLDAWALEVRSVTVVAHARHGRFELVREIAGELPGQLATLLAESPGRSTAGGVGPPLYGALLLAVAMADLDRAERTNDPGVTASGARLVAFAERFGFSQQFQPTMSRAAARESAERADGRAYADAVSAYARLDGGGLLAAALDAINARDRG